LVAPLYFFVFEFIARDLFFEGLDIVVEEVDLVGVGLDGYHILLAVL